MKAGAVAGVASSVWLAGRVSFVLERLQCTGGVCHAGAASTGAAASRRDAIDAKPSIVWEAVCIRHTAVGNSYIPLNHCEYALRSQS